MITLARASALTATAFTAAAVVITLRMPEHGAATVPTYVTPAASQTASPHRVPGCPLPVLAGPPACRAPGSHCPGPLRLPRPSRHAALCAGRSDFSRVRSWNAFEL
jgi:hypothetical protein